MSEAGLTPAREREWHDDGWAMVPGLFAPEHVAAARTAVEAMFPTADEFTDDVDPVRNAPLRAGINPQRIAFPFERGALNRLALHPEMIAMARRLLGVDDVRLYQAMLGAKYAGGPAEAEQLLHIDYHNHTLVVPRTDPGYQHLETFIYLTDVAADTGATRVVSRQLTTHVPVERRALSYDEYADLYRAEVPAEGPAGTVFAYRPDVFHRGVTITRPRTVRFMLHVAYKPADTDWLGYQSWPEAANNLAWDRFVDRASLEQLLVLGFPPPGHPYWNAETLAGVGKRYPTLDLSPWTGTRA